MANGHSYEGAPLTVAAPCYEIRYGDVNPKQQQRKKEAGIGQISFQIVYVTFPFFAFGKKKIRMMVE